MNMSTLQQSLPIPADSDRLSDLRAFEETKAGVKGLVDSGIQTVPKIFIRPPEDRAKPYESGDDDLGVPVIDLAGIRDQSERKRIVGEIGEASRSWGFFQVVNHGIPEEVLEGMLEGIRRFHEQEVEKKNEFHSKGAVKKVSYGSNVDLYRSRAANWRDTLTIASSFADGVEPHELPEICRDSTIDYLNHTRKLGDTLFELLSESLGLKSDHLGLLDCVNRFVLLGHYYPPCPDPDLTMGTSSHTDPSFLTILLQNELGGLQVFRDNRYVNVQPVPGSLVINIGDMLQMIANDEFISADHRVLANKMGPRISIAEFLTGDSVSGKVYAPIKELISEKKPIRYKEFTVREYISKFMQRPIDQSGLDEFRLKE